MDIFDERKVKSNDIVNGLARRDIYDSKGVLQVKEGTRIGKDHYDRLRDQGLIQDDVYKKEQELKRHDINYVSFNSFHTRLDRLTIEFRQLQNDIIEDANPNQREPLETIAIKLKKLSDENIDQLLGELFLSERIKYSFIKPLYITASLIELIKRYNRYKPESKISPERIKNLILAGLTANLGLLQYEKETYSKQRKLEDLDKQKLLTQYPAKSISLLEKLGYNDPVIMDTVKNYTLAADNPSEDALLLRTPFIYAGIALPSHADVDSQNLNNPSKEFALMFSKKLLNPVFGGLFLKINGIVPIGAMLIFDSREKGIVVKGPEEQNIISSTVRLVTTRDNLQLKKPGDKFQLHQSKLQQKGLSNHLHFAWNKFVPHVMWER